MLRVDVRCSGDADMVKGRYHFNASQRILKKIADKNQSNQNKSHHLRETIIRFQHITHVSKINQHGNMFE